jgi:hypothetical protein
MKLKATGQNLDQCITRIRALADMATNRNGSSALGRRIAGMKERYDASRLDSTSFTRWQDAPDPWNNHNNFKDFDNFGDCW